MPRCLGARDPSGTSTSPTSARWALVVHTFCPLTIQSSPSGTALARSEARSEPASGSLNSWAGDPRHRGASLGKVGALDLLGAVREDRRRHHLPRHLPRSLVGHVEVGTRGRGRCGRARGCGPPPPYSTGPPSQPKPASNTLARQVRAAARRSSSWPSSRPPMSATSGPWPQVNSSVEVGRRSAFAFEERGRLLDERLALVGRELRCRTVGGHWASLANGHLALQPAPGRRPRSRSW